MTTEELLKPRYKVTGLYPNSPFAIGDIVYLDSGSNVYRSSKAILEHNFPSIWDCPNIFKPLKWWEERTLDELMSVKYVRITIYTGYWAVGDIVEVTDYQIDTKTKTFKKYILHSTQSSVPQKCEPATEQDYNNQKP